MEKVNKTKPLWTRSVQIILNQNNMKNFIKV